MLNLGPLRKKRGGINIKKIFFLIILASISLITITNVNASNANFYEGEYIDNIYMSKYQYSTNTIYYQKARFFRQSGTNEFAYCIEPFNFFNENSTYESVINPYNLTQEQKTRIERIAHFGYGYKNHTDTKWYAITQMMIWETADSSSGKFFFTDSLNGNKIYPYQNEINEINELVNSYDIVPDFHEKNYDLIEDKELVIYGGDIMKYYSSNDQSQIMDYNNIKISNLKEGKYTFTFYRNDNYYNKPVIFYQSSSSQNLVETGNLEDKVSHFYVNVYRTEININKLDVDTKDTNSQGKASLDGAVFKVLDQKMHWFQEITIENNKALVENIPFGTYYLKEVKAGKGYTLDETLHEVIVTKENPRVDINIYNKVIEKKITIVKTYGENDNFNPEKNVDFEIYDDNNQLIKTVSTDNNGQVTFTLPYGNYKVIQKNTSQGYKLIDPFEINVTEDDNDDETFELKDYKIPVPNTNSNKKFSFLFIIQLLLLII